MPLRDSWTQLLAAFARVTPRVRRRLRRHEAKVLVSRFNVCNGYLIPAGVRPMAVALVTQVLRDRGDS